MKKLFLLTVAVLIIFTANCSAAAPPSYLEIKDIPDDGTKLRQDFKVTVPTNFNASLKNSKLLAVLQPDEIVTRMACIVYTNPAAHKVKVLRKTYACSTRDGDADIILNEGDEVYLIMPTGEGTFIAWHEGKIIWQLDSGINNFTSTEKLAGAWGEYQGAPTNFNLNVTRWDCFRRADWKVGWVLIHDNGKEINYLEPLESD